MISWLGDQYDKRRVMLGALAVFFCGSVGAMAVNNIGEMIAARIAQGAGLSLLPLPSGPAWGWDSAWVLGLFAATALLLAVAAGRPGGRRHPGSGRSGDRAALNDRGTRSSEC